MKKKVSAILICFLLVTQSMLIVTALKKDEGTTILTETIVFYQPSHVPSTEGNETIISVENLSTYYIKAGEPVLPVYQKTYTFPIGTKILDISSTISQGSNQQIKESLPLGPYPFTNLTPLQSFLIQALRIFYHPEKNTNRCLEYRLGSGIQDNKRVVFLSISAFPIQFDTEKRVLSFMDSIKITIEYQLPQQSSQSTQKYNTLILSPQNFSDELLPLINYRNQSNPTLFAALENIPHMGRDTQEDIKLYIKHAIEKWNITKVLLVGGYQQLPCRTVHVDDLRSVIMGEHGFISDLYYADIYNAQGEFSSWDSNNNDLFGEYHLLKHQPTDQVDLYPDVYLGRLACTSEEQVSTIVNKTIKYETTSSPSSDWFKTIIAIGGDTFTEDASGISEGERINDANIKIMNDFTPLRLWGSNQNLQHAEDISAAINNGAGFVFFEGHAGSNSYRTHPQQMRNEWIPVEWYRTYHVNNLANNDKLPIITINACNTCKFSVDHTCLGWSFLINPTGGGIACIGMTCLSWIYPGVFCTYGLGGEIHQNAYRSYKQGANTFGEFWADSITKYLNDHPWQLSVYDYKTIESWQPFGDPALNISLS